MPPLDDKNKDGGHGTPQPQHENGNIPTLPQHGDNDLKSALKPLPKEPHNSVPAPTPTPSSPVPLEDPNKSVPVPDPTSNLEPEPEIEHFIGDSLPLSKEDWNTCML